MIKIIIFLVICCLLSCTSKKKATPVNEGNYPTMMAGKLTQTERFDFVSEQLFQQSLPFCLDEKKPSLQPLVSQNQIQADLIKCYQLNESCTLNNIDFLYAKKPITINKILTHTLTSSDLIRSTWRNQLSFFPKNWLPLFESVRGIIIDQRIIYPHFEKLSGFILLPTHLLTTEQERPSSCQLDDNLFFSFGQYQNEHHHFVDIISPHLAQKISDPIHSSLLQKQLKLMAVLFHELAHAKATFPNNLLAARPKNATLDELIMLISPNLSEQFIIDFPFTDASGVLSLLSKNNWSINSALFEQYSPILLKTLFEQSDALDLYSFHHPREALAIAFELMSMLYFYDLKRTITWFIPQRVGPQKPLIINNRLNDKKMILLQAWFERHFNIAF